MGTKGLHVVSRGKKWAVRKTGNVRVTRRFETQQEAIKAARKIARKQGSVVYIHGRDGQIHARNSFEGFADLTGG